MAKILNLTLKILQYELTLSKDEAKSLWLELDQIFNAKEYEEVILEEQLLKTPLKEA